MTLAAGSRLGPYEIVSLLGAGGMGEVYRARDPRLARDVAVKVLPEDFLEGEEGKARFQREARTLASLNHPGIAAIYSFEEIPSSSSSSSFLGDAAHPRHGADRGRDAHGAPREGADGARAAPADRDADRRRARQGAPAGDRPPGPQAGERHADEGRREATRLRPREGPRARRPHVRRHVAADDGPAAEPHAAGDDPRDVPIHGARAARGRRGGREERHLLVRGGPLRDGDGEEGVRREEPGEPDRVDPEGQPGARLVDLADDASGSGPPDRDLPRERP